MGRERRGALPLLLPLLLLEGALWVDGGGGGGGSRRASERVEVSGRTLPDWMRRSRCVERSAGRVSRISRLRERGVVMVGLGMVRRRSGMFAVKRMVRRREGAEGGSCSSMADAVEMFSRYPLTMCLV